MTLDCGHSNDIIQKRLEAIYDLHTKKMDFRLDKGPYIDLLAALGNPHLHLPPVIHVAGTNGKGSTIAFLKSIYEAAGLSVHVYTSPHLIQFNERIVLGGAQITDDQLLHYFDLIDKANDGASITFFEYTTALAFKAFADNPADICLLETGLGGRLDCTNVIQNPLATLITPIGYDHTEWLGHDIK
jgi:dihydrofolate synthase/folylpolyglutamate synthase